MTPTDNTQFHSVQKAADNAALYTLLLLALLLLFAGGNWVIRHFDLRYPLSFRTMQMMSVAYGFLYAFLEGIIIYIGIENYNRLLKHYINNHIVVNLTSLSIINTFFLLYAALFHNSVSYITGKRLRIDPFSNVASYALARILLISGIVAFTVYVAE
jgi:hypothetical protein